MIPRIIEVGNKNSNNDNKSENDRETTLPPDWRVYPIPTTESSLSTITENFERDGFVCLSDIFPTTFIEEMRLSASTNFEKCFQTMYEKGHILFPNHCMMQKEHHGGGIFISSTSARIHESKPDVKYGEERIFSDDKKKNDNIRYPLKCGIKNGFREMVMRSPGRFEMPFLCESYPFNQPQLLKSESLLRVVRKLLFPRECSAENGREEDIHLSNISIVIATPGATEQKWHADGGHVDLHNHLPCHCLNVFIPLVDMTLDLGPTELRPGTHYHTRNLAPMMLAARARKTLRPSVTPVLKTGDALLFDYRVLHRGKANVGTTDRPILVLTYAKSWFKDVLNFPSRSIHESPRVDFTTDS